MPGPYKPLFFLSQDPSQAGYIEKTAGFLPIFGTYLAYKDFRIYFSNDRYLPASIAFAGFAVGAISDAAILSGVGATAKPGASLLVVGLRGVAAREAMPAAAKLVEGSVGREIAEITGRATAKAASGAAATAGKLTSADALQLHRLQQIRTALSNRQVREAAQKKVASTIPEAATPKAAHTLAKEQAPTILRNEATIEAGRAIAAKQAAVFLSAEAASTGATKVAEAAVMRLLEKSLKSGTPVTNAMIHDAISAAVSSVKKGWDTKVADVFTDELADKVIRSTYQKMKSVNIALAEKLRIKPANDIEYEINALHDIYASLGGVVRVPTVATGLATAAAQTSARQAAKDAVAQGADALKTTPSFKTKVAEREALALADAGRARTPLIKMAYGLTKYTIAPTLDLARNGVSKLGLKSTGRFASAKTWVAGKIKTADLVSPTPANIIRRSMERPEFAWLGLAGRASHVAGAPAGADYVEQKAKGLIGGSEAAQKPSSQNQKPAKATSGLSSEASLWWANEIKPTANSDGVTAIEKLSEKDRNAVIQRLYSLGGETAKAALENISWLENKDLNSIKSVLDAY